MGKKNVVAISGSIRNSSVNESILLAISHLYADTLDINIFKGITEMPPFNPDTSDEHTPESVKTFRNLVDQSDGVIICTPEYVFSVPGTLKNALEWTVSTTIFSDKPTALIVASGLGEKTFESLTLIMNTLGVKMGEDSRLLIQGARSKINIETQTLAQPTLLQIEKLMASFLETMNTKMTTQEV